MPPCSGVPRTFIASAVLAAALLLAGTGRRLAAQVASDTMATVTVLVRQNATPVEGVTVRSYPVGGMTDHRGVVVLRMRPGSHWLHARRVGFRPDSIQVTVRPGADTTVGMFLL